MLMKILQSKRADGYVFPCVMILVLCMLLSVFIFFASTASWIRVTKENSETVMDSYIMENSIEIYNSIKQGNDYTEILDREKYVDKLCSFCTLVKSSSYLYHYDSDGRLQYRMSKPRVTFIEENTLKIQISYTLYVPVYFNGRPLRNAVIPVVIKSAFSEKF